MTGLRQLPCRLRRDVSARLLVACLPHLGPPVRVCHCNPSAFNVPVRVAPRASCDVRVGTLAEMRALAAR
jgi:hypothetical protein